MTERLISAKKLQQYAKYFKGIQGTFIKEAQKDQEAARAMVIAGVAAAKADSQESKNQHGGGVGR